MTGIADLYLYLKRPYSKDRRQRLLAHFTTSSSEQEVTRFVVLSWKRTGSNLLCGILHFHPEICMHNELFNPIDIFTYHPQALKENKTTPEDGASSSSTTTTGPFGRWTVLTRDLFPVHFLEYIWHPQTVARIRPRATAVGFKSFPEHWWDARNEDVWHEYLLRDFRVKKIVLRRRDELAVYLSMQRADLTGRYMTHKYPKDMKIHICPAAFQAFVNHYRETFRNKYRSPMEKRDSFYIDYEDLIDLEAFGKDRLPQLWNFLGVDPAVPLRTLQETVKQADPTEDYASVIENYDELEFCFRHTNVLHFAERRRNQQEPSVQPVTDMCNSKEDNASMSFEYLKTWSILLPICSRPRSSQAAPPVHSVNGHRNGYDGSAKRQHNFNTNRFLDLTLSSQHDHEEAKVDPEQCWDMLEEFGASLRATATVGQLALTECIVGIDVDDRVFEGGEARERIRRLLPCPSIVFVRIQPNMYGHVCKIWNFLASKASHDFIVLLGDDIQLLDFGWQPRIVKRFQEIAMEQGLPFGAACVAMNDLSFPGFPTFPVLHRWHMTQFGSLLPRQFANQGGDPFLYELYSRFNAASFCMSGCGLENTIGGDGDARYQKHQINWRGHILNMNLRKLKGVLDMPDPKGIVLDVVVPSYRTNNNAFLKRIALLRASIKMYVKFWFVVDNPCKDHVAAVKKLADDLNREQLKVEGNYFVNVIHYGENRGASYARNTGYNYTTADWVLFLDDDVIPDQHILDAYAGAIQRYPNSKVFVGYTELPEACNTWTEMLRACNVGYFYGIAEKMVHPSWGVTANLMVRGSRHNGTIQFKEIYPKTGGGEDIDFVYQFKNWYRTLGRLVTVGVPEAKVTHPWWNQAQPCYRQIAGWAWGDSLCITQWSGKTFMAFPNWIEHVTFIVTPLALYTGRIVSGLTAGLGVTLLEHIIKCAHYYPDARRVTDGDPWWRSLWVALGAGSVLSSQEVTRTAALLYRRSLYSLCRRVDWFDGQEERIRLDIQLSSLIRFLLNAGVTWTAFRSWRSRNQ